MWQWHPKLSVFDEWSLFLFLAVIGKCPQNSSENKFYAMFSSPGYKLFAVDVLRFQSQLNHLFSHISAFDTLLFHISYAASEQIPLPAASNCYSLGKWPRVWESHSLNVLNIRKCGKMEEKGGNFPALKVILERKRPIGKPRQRRKEWPDSQRRRISVLVLRMPKHLDTA